MRKVNVVVLALGLSGGFVFSAASVHAQGTARDPRVPGAPAVQARVGTGEVSVFVSTDEANSRPLRRVSVSIQAGEADIPNIGVTDDDGRVVFRNIAPGNYLLIASRTGYVRTFYGSKFPGRGPGVAVTVLEGKKNADVRIRMLRGSVLTGTIRTATGRPAPNQTVQAVMLRSGGGDRRAVSIEGSLGAAVTDDRGVYRIFGIAPGDYMLLVPSTAFGAEELRPMTNDELRWADGLVASGAAAAPAAGLPQAPEGAPSVAYAPVYYPGTPVATDATVISLRPNEERSGLDFSLQLVPTAVVTGRVVDSDGRPQSGVTVTLKPARNDGLDMFSAMFNATGRTVADGVFTVRGVKPGAYTASVRATPKTGAEPATPPTPAQMQAELMASIMGGGSGTHWAEESLNVQGRDVSDVVLTLRPGMTVSGKIVYEATTKPQPTDFNRTGLTFMTAPTGTSVNDMLGALMGGAGTSQLKIETDGRFSVTGVAPGKYRLNSPMAMLPMPGMPSMSGGWTLKGAMAGGRDIADAVLEMRSGVNVSDVVVTFTDAPAELSGSVIDGAGRATADFPIVVFSTDRAYWTLGSRRVQTGRPSSDGKYKITLPAGEYFVSAVTSVDRTEAYDPAFLETLIGASFKITIKDGEKKTQDLKLGGGSE